MQSRLKLIRFSHRAGRCVYWLAKCRCGTVKAYALHNVKSGATRSCGCLFREVAGKHSVKHGMTGSPTYVSYQAMLARCRNPNRWYADRGIKVCARWKGRNGFANFLADMGKRPDGHTIERRKVQEGYSPANCFWLAKSLQNRNTRSNRMLTFQGKTQCLAAWAEELGLNRRTLGKRIEAGWPVSRALTEPITPGRRRAQHSQFLASLVP